MTLDASNTVDISSVSATLYPCLHVQTKILPDASGGPVASISQLTASWIPLPISLLTLS